MAFQAVNFEVGQMSWNFPPQLYFAMLEYQTVKGSFVVEDVETLENARIFKNNVRLTLLIIDPCPEQMIKNAILVCSTANGFMMFHAIFQIFCFSSTMVSDRLFCMTLTPVSWMT